MLNFLGLPDIQRMKEDEERIFPEIGARIRELRKQAGFTSYETFAYTHNIEKKQVWRLEKGYNFTMKTLDEILKIHKTSLEEFFRGM